MSEIAWIGAMLAVGGVVGTLIVGWMVDRFGRKSSLLSLAAPQIVGYIFSAGFFVGSTNKFYNVFFSVGIIIDNVCTERLLLVCVTLFEWTRRRWRIYHTTNDFSRNSREQVN